MKVLFAAGALCVASTLPGCASDGRAVNATASSPTSERAAAETAEAMAAAMEANPETISPDAAELARLMAELMRQTLSTPVAIRPVGEALPAVAR